jgi:extradiol dioxygenase family protein
MIKTLDHLIIAVEDLEKAETDYAKVFGVEACMEG